MRAIVIERRELVLRDIATPEPGPSEVRVRIHACAVNRADVLQRLGAYPAPPDAPADIPGLEVAGVIDAVGPGVRDRSIGDRVFGVVGGGAYAEAVVVHERTLAPMPDAMSFTDAAAIPEAFVTAYDAMVVQAGLQAGERVLVHAAGSGVGTAAIQIARSIGATAIGTARSEAKLERARALGLARGLIGPDGTFAAEVRELGGAHVVLELVGGAYVPESLAALVERGRLVLVGLMAGARTEIDLGIVLRRRLRIVGTVLRSRPIEEKILAAQLLAGNLAPLFAAGTLVPIVDRVLPLAAANDAHRAMQANETFGKIVLSVVG
jgi:NADPH:quinone reductase